MAHELRLPHTDPLVDLRTRIYRRDSDHIFHGNVSELARRQCQSGRQPQERIKRYSETARTKSAPYRGLSSLPGTFFERMIASCNLARASLSRLKYPDNLAGGPLLRLRYPANLAGIPDALIFFCLLFFHQGKKRRKKSFHLSHQEKKRRKKSFHFSHQGKAPNRERSS